MLKLLGGLFSVEEGCYDFICMDKISTKRHALSVLVHVALYVGFWAVYANAGGVEYVVFAATLVWISCVDFAIFEVPDTASFLLFVSGIWASYESGVVFYLLGSLLWGGIFLLAALTTKKVLGEEGLGLGDVKLMGGIGMWLGPLAPLYVVLCASLGAILTILITQRSQPEPNARKAIAFGPFLCLSAWVVWMAEVGR